MGRKSIVIFGIIMSFIIGSLVSGPFATAQMGTPFLEEEIQAIEEIIAGMQDQLNNISVSWENVTDTPMGFGNVINTEGIFQGVPSANMEPCQAGDVVTWDGTQWVCAAVTGGLSFGTEVVVLDNSGFDDGPAGHPIVLSSNTGVTAGAEFTMPVTAGAYRISAIEVKTGSTANSNFSLCTGVFETQGNTTLPLANGERLAVNQVASARSGITASGLNDVKASTVHKLPAVSAIIKGGEDLIVFFKPCSGSPTMAGAQATNTWGVTISDPFRFTGPSVGTPSVIIFPVAKAGFDYYVKVYAEPLQ